MRPLFLSLAALLVGAGTANAQQSPSSPGFRPPGVMAKVYACAEVAEPQARLACFDAEIAALKAAETSGQFTAVDAARARQIQRESFGFHLPSLPQLGLAPSSRSPEGAAQRDDLNSQAMKIARAGRFDGRPSFIMENGQIWVVIDTADNRHAKAGANVTIRKAALGSFLMSVEAGGRALRVRRAQ